MIINKLYIAKAFNILASVYPEFAKRTEDKDVAKEMINTWAEVIAIAEPVDKNVNEALLNTVKKLVSVNKYMPNLAEIIEEVRIIKASEETYKEVDISDLTDEEYDMLVRKKITLEELIEKGKVHV